MKKSKILVFIMLIFCLPLHVFAEDNVVVEVTEEYKQWEQMSSEENKTENN